MRTRTYVRYRRLVVAAPFPPHFPDVTSTPGRSCGRRPPGPLRRYWPAIGSSPSPARSVTFSRRAVFGTRQHGRARWASGCGVDDRCAPARRGNHLRRRVGSGRRPCRNVGRGPRPRSAWRWNGARSSATSPPTVGRRSSVRSSTGFRSSRPQSPGLRPGDARRLTARPRRATVLVALGPWPVEASLRLHAQGRNWSGLVDGGGLLASTPVDVRVEGKGVPRACGPDERAAEATGATHVVSASSTGCVWCPDSPVNRGASTRGRFGRRRPARPTAHCARTRGESRHLRCAAADRARSACVRGGVSTGPKRRCPEAVCVDVDEANEARTFEVVARRSRSSLRASCSNGRVVVSSPHRGPSRYFGGDDALAAKIRDGVAGVLGPDGDDVRVGIADGVFVARLAAPAFGGGARGRVGARSSRRGRCRCSTTTISRRCSSGSACRRSARSPRSRPMRCSPASGARAARIHHSRGIDPGPSVLVAPPPDLVERTELDPPAERVDVAAFAAKSSPTGCSSGSPSAVRVHACPRRGGDRARRTAQRAVAARHRLATRCTAACSSNGCGGSSTRGSTPGTPPPVSPASP